MNIAVGVLELEEKTMRLRAFAILLTIPLWACASKPEGGAGTGASALDTTLGVIETPLLIAFKIPLCVGSAPVFAPGAVVSSVFPLKDTSKGNGWQRLANSVSEACGPPYVATPQYGTRQQ